MKEFRASFDWLRFVVNTGTTAFFVMFVYLGGNAIGLWGGPVPEGPFLPGLGPAAAGFVFAFLREVWAYRVGES